MTDNHYGIFQYGTSHVYGASSTGELEALAWGIEVDWDADGSFDGVNEANHLIKAPTIKRGRRTMLKPSGQGFEQVRTGQAVIVLSNHDGRYDAWNTSSPLYPNVESGKDIRIRVLDKYTGTIYNRFYGIIQDIVPSGYDSEAIVTIYADDAFRVLRDTQVTVARPYTDGTFAPAAIDEIVDALLDAVQWPARWGSTINSAQDGVRYWYASGDRNVAAELDDVIQSFFGYGFIANNGQFKYYPRFVGELSILSIDEEEMLKDIGNPQPWSIRRNIVKIRFHIRKRADDVEVWQPLAEDPPIEPGETKEYFVEYTYNGYPAYLEGYEDSFIYSRSPNALDDSGLTHNVTATDYRTRAFLSVNNPYSEPIYLFYAPFPETRSYIRGDITWTEKAETISSPRNPSSVENQRALVLDSLWYQDRNMVPVYVDQYKAFISILHKTPIIQVENRFAKQFTPDLFSVITVNIPKLGISSEDFRVGGIEESSVGETTQAVRTTFYLEPFLQQADGVGYWSSGITLGQWDISNWDW